MKRYMAHILISAEKITEHFLKVQVHDEGTWQMVAWKV